MDVSQLPTIGCMYDTKMADIILIVIRLIATFLIAAALPYRCISTLAFFFLFLLCRGLDHSFNLLLWFIHN